MPDSTTSPHHAVILTALRVEYQAVRAYLTGVSEETHPQGTIYERGTFSSGGRSWDVAIVEIGMGGLAAALEAERAITHFKPEVILFVGVAGGLKNVQLGDVVAATKVYGYESGKAEREFLPRPSIGSSTYRMEQRAKAEGRKKDWLQRIRGARTASAPKVYVEPIAAGEKVIASTESAVTHFLRSNYSDAVAVEMEGHGFLQATHANPQVEALIIRGISDRIDDKQEADKAQWQEVAARHASAFAFEMLAKLDVREVSSQRSGQARFAAPFPSIWNVSRRHQPYFTGREHIFKRLRDAFAAYDEADLIQPQAIVGQGGVGKTQTAAEYAFRYRGDYHSVLWARADTRTTLASDFVTLAHLLQVAENGQRDQRFLKEAVMKWCRENTDWLLILDNADDIAMVSEFIPQAGRGHILLTTRALATGGVAGRVDLEPLGPEDGALCLLRRASIIQSNGLPGETTKEKYHTAQEISRAVAGLPLALEQAGAYIEETAYGLSRYLSLYEARRKELIQERHGPVPEYPEAVATTWRASIELVREDNPAAVELLHLCAFLAPDDIPEVIITEGAAHLGPVLRPVAADSLKLNRALAMLLKHSLLQRDEDQETLSMHRLRQEVQRDEMNAATQQVWAERAVRAVSQALSSVSLTDWRRSQQLLPHAQVCAALVEQWQMTFPEATALLQRARDS